MRQVQDGDKKELDLGSKRPTEKKKIPVKWKQLANHPGYFTDGKNICRKEDLPAE